MMFCLDSDIQLLQTLSSFFCLSGFFYSFHLNFIFQVELVFGGWLLKQEQNFELLLALYGICKNQRLGGCLVFCKCQTFCPFKPPPLMPLLDHVMNILSKGLVSTRRWSCMCRVGKTALQVRELAVCSTVTQSTSQAYLLCYVNKLLHLHVFQPVLLCSKNG